MCSYKWSISFVKIKPTVVSCEDIKWLEGVKMKGSSSEVNGLVEMKWWVSYEDDHGQGK